MKNAQRRILRGKQHPNLAERAVARAMHSVIVKSPEDLKKRLRRLRVISCHQVDVTGEQKAIVVQVPFGQRVMYRKVQAMLSMQMEKLVRGKHIIFVTKRTIVPVPKLASIYRPRSMSRTNVHEAILNDIVYPANIVAQHIRCRPGAKKLRIVYLDRKDKKMMAPKLRSFRAVFKKLTGRDASFEFGTQ